MFYSLTEEEFTGLQGNLEQTFEAVEALFKIVKEKVQLRSCYEEIVQAVNQAYRISPEHSNYYRNQYLDLLDFLRGVRTDLDSLEKEENQEKIEEQLKKDIEEPLYQKKEAVLKFMATRKKLKSRIGDNTSDFEPMEVTLYHLYQEIWQALGFDAVGQEIDSSVCDKMKELILSIIHLKNRELKVLRKEEISKHLEDMDEHIKKMQQDYETFRNKINLLETSKPVKVQDKVLEELIDLIEKVPLDQVDYYSGGNPRKELQMIKNGSWLFRRAVYSNWKVIPHGEGKYQKKIDLSLLLLYVGMQVSYSDYLNQIIIETFDKINSIFLLELWDSITDKEIPNTDLYCKNFGKTAILETSSEDICKKIIHEKEIGALRGIVYNFYLSFVKSEEERERIHACLADEKLDKVILEIVKKIEQVQDDSVQILQESLEKVNSRYITISSKLENIRAVQEEDIINAVIDQMPVVYQKTIGNES